MDGDAPMPLLRLLLATALFAAASLPLPACAEAEGGPPMLTDDPGTPGDGKWEINVSALSDHAGATTTFQLPLLDLNYGVGDRVQLNFQVPWLVQHSRSDGNASGFGASLIGVKWRFFDAGDDGWQVSTYPHVESRFPVARRALSDPGVSYLLPLEFAHALGNGFALNFEAGRWLRPAPQSDSWIAGVVLGHELHKGLDVLAELHAERDVHSGRNELTANVGARWDWSERCTLLVAIGSDLHNSLGERDTLLTYLGVQLHL